MVTLEIAAKAEKFSPPATFHPERARRSARCHRAIRATNLFFFLFSILFYFSHDRVRRVATRTTMEGRRRGPSSTFRLYYSPEYRASSLVIIIYSCRQLYRRELQLTQTHGARRNVCDTKFTTTGLFSSYGDASRVFSFRSKLVFLLALSFRYRGTFHADSHSYADD